MLKKKMQIAIYIWNLFAGLLFLYYGGYEIWMQMNDSDKIQEILLGAVFIECGIGGAAFSILNLKKIYKFPKMH